MQHPVIHSSFTIERRYPHPPAKVFRALTEQPHRRRWFVEGDGFEIESYACDYRVGGEERCAFRPVGGPRIETHAVVMDIVAGERTVACYSMAMEGHRFSVSQITSELFAEDVDGVAGTRLVFTELAAYFNGDDGTEGRKEGSLGLMEKLAAYLGQMD